jgi:NADH dehydrogenase/NADH:ubiquinone oxidoreductase subunit G
VIKSTKGSNEDVLKALSAAVAKLGLTKKTAAIPPSELQSLTAKTSILTDDYLDAAFVIASSEKPVIVYKDGVEIEALKAFADLINARLICLKGSANSLAASQLGLDGSLNLDQKKVLFVANGDDELSQKTIKELEKVPFKAVVASYASALTSMADVVLPSTEWLEQEGHYISSDGTVLSAKRSITPAEDILSPFEVVGKLAEKLGVQLTDDWAKKVHVRVSSVELVK